MRDAIRRDVAYALRGASLPLAACYLPARRASRTDPLSILRND